MTTTMRAAACVARAARACSATSSSQPSDEGQHCLLCHTHATFGGPGCAQDALHSQFKRLCRIVGAIGEGRAAIALASESYSFQCQSFERHRSWAHAPAFERDEEAHLQ